MKTFLIGNGLNRCIVNNISWGDLLKNIANEYGVELEDSVSFPMQFECIANQILFESKKPSDTIYEEIKTKIAKRMEVARLPYNAPHFHYTKKADCLLTTNYDFMLEQSLDRNFSIIDIKNKTRNSHSKYNLQNSVNAAEKEVFHIHGHIQKPKTICLGYEHYAGTLQHLRDEISTKKKEHNNLPAVLVSIQNPKTEIGNCWAKKLFTDEVHIVGLGMGESEIDIWWAITYRSFLIYSNRFEANKYINNRIVFHDIGVEPNNKLKYMLVNNAVEYSFHHINSNDSSAYLYEYLTLAESIK